MLHNTGFKAVALALAKETTGEPSGLQEKDASSREALAVFRSKPNFFDAIITDQTMSEMTGTELHSNYLSEEQARAPGIGECLFILRQPRMHTAPENEPLNTIFGVL